MIRNGEIVVDRKRLMVAHRGVECFWHSRRNVGCHNYQFELAWHLILSGGMTARRLFDLLYAGDAGGGPLDGHHVIWVYLAHLKPWLARLGLEIRSRRSVEGKRYFIVPIDA